METLSLFIHIFIYCYLSILTSGNTFNCNANNECRDLILTCNPNEDCAVQCSGFKSCQNVLVNCPQDFECTVDCTGSEACINAEINAALSSKLNVPNCYGSNMCTGIILHCPPHSQGPGSNTENCHVSGDNGLSDVTFYAIYGWNDMDISYDGNFNSASGEMFCTANYLVNCVISDTSFTACTTNVCDGLTREPTSAPTKMPTSYSPTQPPSITPSTSPSQPPSASPSDAPSIAPSIAPSQLPSGVPSMAPTLAPTIAPTMGLTPTKAPTFTNKYLYVDKDGCDYGYCTADGTNCALTPTSSPTFTPTCQSIAYSWECFLGNGGFPNSTGCTSEFNGNGVFNLGSGDWDFPYQVNLDDADIIIKGKGAKSTIFNYNGAESPWFMCRWYKCYIGIQDLTLKSSKTYSDNDYQFYMRKGGTIAVKNVIFDGINYQDAIPNGGQPFWNIFNIDSNIATISFQDCYFTNNNVMYQFINGVNVIFINCTFSGNLITDDNNHKEEEAMFFVDGSSILISNCSFLNNLQDGRRLFQIQNNAEITIINSNFIGNLDTTGSPGTQLIFVNNSNINVADSYFEKNSDYQAIIYFEDATINNINFECPLANNSQFIISSSIFNENENIDHLLYIYGGYIYLDDITINKQSCDMDCISSTDSSLFINQNILNQTSTVFNHIDSSKNDIICSVSAFSSEVNVTINNFNKDNSKIIVDECLPPFINDYNVSFDDRTHDIQSTEIFIYDEPVQTVDAHLGCSGNTTFCKIFCNATVACFSNFFTIKAMYSDILCQSTYSCQTTTIEATLDTNIGANSSVHVICVEKGSCSESVIIVDNIDYVTIDCIDIESCTLASITITNSILSEINCYEQNSCDDIKIITDDDTTAVTLHQHSSNVQISNPGGYSPDNLKCAPSGAYFIWNESYSTLQESLYTVLPCNDVHYVCNKTDTCDIIESTLFGEYDFFNCYGPIYYADIIDLRCYGSCPGSPTRAPSSAPTISPTQETDIPTNAPSFSPTISPTNGASPPPTKSPTMEPTLSPTTATPTVSPTYSPTLAPTAPPTFSPIASKDFDSYILITYLLKSLNQTDIMEIINDTINTIPEIEWVIKETYWTLGFLPFDTFLVEIKDINGVPISDIDIDLNNGWLQDDELKLNATVECGDNDEENYCEAIKHISQGESFPDIVSDELQIYFDNNLLNFTVYQPFKLEIVCKECRVPFDYFFPVLGGIVSILVLIGIAAFLFNKRKFPKLCGFHRVDNGKWLSIMVFALQFWDFASDINLSIEIWSNENVFNELLLCIAAIGSTSFVFIPYIANLIIAANVKNIIKNNVAAKGWFQFHAKLFTILVVITGGSYSALALVSSGVFGLQIMTCGLTQYELKQMGKIKIVSTVILENVPQMLVQGLYTYAINGITDGVTFAFIASALSVTASSLSYFIEKDSSDTKVVQYYLFTQCEKRIRRNTANQYYNAVEQVMVSSSEQIKRNKSMASYITDDEKQNLLEHRGLSETLGQYIAEIYHIPPKNIEVGYSMITKYGIITHIVHFIYDQDIEHLVEELKNDPNMQNKVVLVTPKFFIQHLFSALNSEINDVFREHFQLNNDFEVTLNTNYGKKYEKEESDKYKTPKKKRDDIFKKMVSTAQLSIFNINPMSDGYGNITGHISDDNDNNMDQDNIDLNIGRLIINWLDKKGYDVKPNRLNNILNSIEKIEDEKQNQLAIDVSKNKKKMNKNNKYNDKNMVEMLLNESNSMKHLKKNDHDIDTDNFLQQTKSLLNGNHEPHNDNNNKKGVNLELVSLK